MENLKHYFIDEINIIIDGIATETVTMTGSGMYDPNQIKRSAENMLREAYPNSKITSILLTHKNVTLEEYKEIIGKNPPWLGNIT